MGIAIAILASHARKQLGTAIRHQPVPVERPGPMVLANTRCSVARWGVAVTTPAEPEFMIEIEAVTVL